MMKWLEGLSANLPSRSEWWQAIRWVVLIFSVLVVLAIAGSFVPYQRVITEGHPWLPKVICSGCMFCGMTRSFCAMSSGIWLQAYEWNRAGPLLYVLGWIWVGVFVKTYVSWFGKLVLATVTLRRSRQQR